MKKTAAILLLTLFLFNLFGYKVWFYYMQSRSQQQVQASLDKQQYNDNELITIKVPLSLPYFTDWKEFEEYDGSIEFNGQHYNYVKRKVYQDTLILLCLPNNEQNRLSAAKSDYEKLVSTPQSSSGNSKSGNTILLLKVLLGGYRETETIFECCSFANAPVAYHTFYSESISPLCLKCPWQPPELI